MAVLKFLSVAAAAIFLSEASWTYVNTEIVEPPRADLDATARGEPPTVEEEPPEVDSEAEAVANKAERGECLKEINAARSLVGFAELEQENKFKISANDWAENEGEHPKLTAYLKNVCDAVKTNKAPQNLEGKIEGTFAYAVQDGENADCQAAVDYWKGAFTNFNGELPPKYDANTTPYNDPRNVSFISLFNPQATHFDCAYFICPPAPTNDKLNRDTATEEEVKALVCVTTPNVLTADKQPYEQEQWDKIVAGLNPSSAVAAAPAALVLAAATLTALLL